MHLEVFLIKLVNSQDKKKRAKLVHVFHIMEWIDFGAMIKIHVVFII